MLVLAGAAADAGLALFHYFTIKTEIMNKLFGFLLAGAFCLGIRGGLQAQDNASLLNINAIGADPAAVRASRDFWSRSGERSDEQWFKLGAGYQAEFTEASAKGQYMYDRKGKWVYSILTYGEEKLPEEVRQQVRSKYYDFSIRWVKEVRENENLVYVVHMESAGEWKDVAVQEGQMRVLNSFCK